MPDLQTSVAAVQRLVGAAVSADGAAPVQEYVRAAVSDLDLVSPRIYRATLTGDGTDEYALASPWERGFSVMRRVLYYPSNDRNEPPTILRADEYTTDELDASNGPQIRFYIIAPAAADRVVLEYTARHTIADAAAATTTLSATEARAVEYRAAALLLRAAAAEAATTAPQSIDVDFATSSIQNSGDALRRLADDCDEDYRRTLGLPEDGSAASSGVFISTPVTPGRSTAGPLLTYPRRRPSWPS